MTVRSVVGPCKIALTPSVAGRRVSSATCRIGRQGIRSAGVIAPWVLTHPIGIMSGGDANLWETAVQGRAIAPRLVRTAQRPNVALSPIHDALKSQKVGRHASPHVTLELLICQMLTQIIGLASNWAHGHLGLHLGSRKYVPLMGMIADQQNVAPLRTCSATSRTTIGQHASTTARLVWTQTGIGSQLGLAIQLA